MAPSKSKNSLLELCTSSITLGNSVAVHCLDYLSIVKEAPHGFNKLAVEFLETSRVIIPARAGLAEAERSNTTLPADVTNELLERFRQVKNAFTVLDQVVSRYIDSEKKSGFGKLGKGFRMMFADNEIEKLRLSLVSCREALAKNHRMQTWSLGEAQIEPAAGIGYTALSAVLDKPDPTRGKPSPEMPRSNLVSRSPPELPPLPPTPMYSPSLSSRLDMPSSSLPESALYERGLAAPPALQRDSSRTSTTSPPFGSRTSSLPLTSDNLSDITTPTSIAEMDEMMSIHELNEKRNRQPMRVMVDSSKVPRWTPSRPTGTISAGSKTALLAAVQQQNHKMIEQLLDCGVPVDSGYERSLLTVAIVNNDFTTIRLLLLFGADPNAKDKDCYSPLFSATQASFLDAAQLLLKYSADCNMSAGPYDESPFARALNSGQTAFVDLYLRYGAEPDTIMGNGNTAFIQAITKTVPINLLELMLVYNADANCKNGRGETALFKAINAERLDLVELLINHGANVNLPGPKHMLWPAVHQTSILGLLLEKGADLSKAPGVLELATSINSLPAVRILLDHNVDLGAKKDGIFTPLCTAIRDNHENLVEILLAAGADPNLKASEYPAFKCITHHRPHLLPRLVAAGAKLDSPKGIIETAVAHNEKECLLFLLEQGVDVNARGASGNTGLTTAIKNDRIHLLDILLSYGADPGVRGQEWPIALAVKNPKILAKLLPRIAQSKIIKGALEMAVVADQLESVKLLIAKGVSVEEKNGGVFSPLTTSIREDRKAIFRYLIDEAGADPNSPGEHLPIIKSIRRHRENDLSYIEHLITKGADINLMYRGWNAVLQAVDNGDTQILKLLAQRGNPDLDARDENGRSVLEIMDERGLIEEERILLGGRSPSPKIREANSQLREFVRA
ncbi:uncharacterized protein LTR77_008725 [Saxophila tyrrhenica]|uniref:Ankyrin repeat protein n=1 Tax=Saxophila tyrrhenica TaxID=1690608 RepID=A0AAV9P0H0_9PEZI|nr:hypothetical protein LTR77_008725 [Saxophila tyrrhenica]